MFIYHYAIAIKIVNDNFIGDLEDEKSRFNGTSEHSVKNWLSIMFDGEMIDEDIPNVSKKKKDNDKTTNLFG